MSKPISNRIKIADAIAEHLDTLSKWEAPFIVHRATDGIMEIVFNNGCRVIVRVSEATPNRM